MKPIDILLETAELRSDPLELFRVSEAVGAAVGGVETSEVEVSAALAWCFAIALDFTPLALVAGEGMASQREAWMVGSRGRMMVGGAKRGREAMTYQAMEMYWDGEHRVKERDGSRSANQIPDFIAGPVLGVESRFWSWAGTGRAATTAKS